MLAAGAGVARVPGARAARAAAARRRSSGSSPRSGSSASSRPSSLKRYGVGQPAGRLLPPARRVRVGRHHRPGGADLPRRHHAGRDRSGCGPGPGTPASASPSTPAPRTNGRCRRSGGRPTASPRSRGRSAGCSAGSPPCSPRRSPACRRSTFTIVVTVAGLGAALLGGFQSFPLTLLGGLIIGVGEAMATLYGGDITGLLPPGPDHRAQPHAGVPRDLPRGRRARPRPARCGRTSPSGCRSSGPARSTSAASSSASAIVARPALRGDGRGVGQATYISLATAIMILSIVVLTGYAGQISLAQWALAGIGALIAGRLRARRRARSSSPSSSASCSRSRSGLVFAVPALRTRGVNLAVVTLGLGFLVSEVVFANPNYLGGALDGGTRIGRVKLFGIEVDAFNHPHAWAAVSLVVLRAARAARRQPPPVAHRPAAHRRAHERARRRVARHLGVRRQALRVRRVAPAWPRSPASSSASGARSSPTPSSTSSRRSTASATPSSAVSATCSARSSARRTRSAASAPASSRTGSASGTSGTSSSARCILFVILIVHQNGIADVVVARPPAVGEAPPRRPAPGARAAPAGRGRAGAGRDAVDRRSLTVRFGSVVAVDDVSMEVRPGEVVGLIGPNGAGKTTLIDAVTGFVAGQRRIDRARRSAHRPVERDASGPGSGCGARSSRSSCSRTSASRRTSGPGSDQRASRLSWVTDLFWPGRHDLPPTAVAAVHEFELEPHLDQTPEELPYGRRRLVGIARTVASGPSVVMLDEPAAGLDENESARARAPHPAARRRAQHGRAPRRARRRPRDVDLRPHRGDRLRQGDRAAARPRRSAATTRCATPTSATPTRSRR